MNIIGVIAEFNPFHKGHQYLFNTIRKELSGDAIIVVMSGDFVQRGAPAISDKFSRTRMALQGGADLVLELPVRYSLSSAESFALSGVGLLHQLGIVNKLVFGMETAVAPASLWKLSDFLLEEPLEYRQLLQTHMKQGYSFPAARAQALSQCLPDTDTNLVNTPNNILAIEYCKALRRLSSPISIHPILRRGTVSAHNIRSIRRKNNEAGIYTDDFSQAFHLQYWNYIHSGTINSPSDIEFTEELFHRLCNELQPEDSLTELIFKCKTKQYTHSRISRCFFRFLLHLNDTRNITDLTEYAPYGRILGFRSQSAHLLGLLKEQSQIPILQKLIQGQKELSPEAKQMLQEDLAAHEYYRIISMQKYPDSKLKNDFQSGMVIL